LKNRHKFLPKGFINDKAVLYHKKENIARDRVLKQNGYSQIGDFAYVTDGIHTSIDYCEKSNIHLFSATTPRENYFDLSRGVYISEKAVI